MCYGWGDAVGCYGDGNLFGLDCVAEEDQRELEKGVTLHLLCASVFVDQVPSRRNLYDDVARTLLIKSVANGADARCPCPLCDAVGGEHVPYA